MSVSHYGIFVVGLVYIVGGLNEMNGEMQSVDIYNPVTERWTKASDMQTKRAYVGVAAANGFIYAVGGWTEKDGALATVERYSVAEVRLLFSVWTVLFVYMCMPSKFSTVAVRKFLKTNLRCCNIVHITFFGYCLGQFFSKIMQQNDHTCNCNRGKVDRSIW